MKMLLHLFFIFHFGINAFPIITNTSDNHNSTFDFKEKLILSRKEINESSVGLNLSSILANIQVPKDFNLTQVANGLKNFGIGHLKDDKHLEGSPLDRHGKVNPDFHKEIFLGNHELFEIDIQHNPSKRNKKLEEIFNQADLNHDERLSKEELLDHVFQNIQQHLKEAKDRNSQIFLLIDTNQDGKVTWQEYAALYVQFHHMDGSSIKDLNDIDFIQNSFNDTLQQELLKIRYRWIEADSDGDNELNIDEFLEFRHPETAGRLYKYIVEDIVKQMDLNDDQRLNETEFVIISSNDLDDIDNQQQFAIKKQWSKERKIEFKEMDENEDGVLTRDELLKAYDPMNRVHINIQIKRLFSVVDDSPKDDLLSLDEIKNHADVFTDMHLLDAEETLHDEI